MGISIIDCACGSYYYLHCSFIIGLDLAYVRSDLDDEAGSFGFEARLPTPGGLDLVGAFGRMEYEHRHAYVAGIGFDLHGTQPGVVGSYLTLGSQIAIPEVGDKEFGYQAGAGLEIRPNDVTSLMVGVAYAHMDEEGQTMLPIGLYAWLFRRVLFGLSVVRGFDPGGTTGGLGLAIGF
jgi:hypothetical protein